MFGDPKPLLWLEAFKRDKIPLKSAKGPHNPSPKQMLLFYESRQLTKYSFRFHGAEHEVMGEYKSFICKNYIVLGNVVHSEPRLTLSPMYISSTFFPEIQEVCQNKLQKCWKAEFMLKSQFTCLHAYLFLAYIV